MLNIEENIDWNKLYYFKSLLQKDYSLKNMSCLAWPTLSACMLTIYRITESQNVRGWKVSWVWPGKGKFLPEARRGHSWAGWPHLAKQNRVFDTMCCHAGFRWGELHGGKSVAAWERVAVASGESSVLYCFVLCVLLICIIVVPVPFVCCSVKLPLSRPTCFCLFLSILLRTPAGEGAAAWHFCCQLQPNQNIIVHNVYVNSSP